MFISDLTQQLESGSLEIESRPYADTGIFISRIREFESMYEMRWFEFENKWASTSLKPKSDEERLDFAEWHMLCSRFSEELEEGLTIQASPPPTSEFIYSNEGPSDRAFTILLDSDLPWQNPSLLPNIVGSFWRRLRYISPIAKNSSSDARI